MSNFRLYILVRNDVDALKHPGKMAAQVSHASTAFATNENTNQDDFIEWDPSDIGFGTTIVLSVSSRELYDAIKIAHEYSYSCGLVEDKTFPWDNGQGTIKAPLITCGYIFGDAEALKPILDGYKLLG